MQTRDPCGIIGGTNCAEMMAKVGKKSDMYIEILKAILFGIVEGITEWLPISSTGHLILLDELIHLKVTPEFYEMFQVVIQLGAILAVIVLFFQKLNPFSPAKSEPEKQDTWHLWAKVVVGVAPSALLGLLLDDWMDAHLYHYAVVALMLILYGGGFMLVEYLRRGKTVKISEVSQLDYRTALLIGAFQCLSLVPGTSRSGSTILGAILLGVGRSAGSEFSFFMAVPTMLGASAIKLLKFLVSGAAFGFGELMILLVGTVVSFIVSMIAIRALMNYVRKHSFSAFGWYRIVLGAVVLVYFVIKGILA